MQQENQNNGDDPTYADKVDGDESVPVVNEEHAELGKEPIEPDPEESEFSGNGDEDDSEGSSSETEE